MLVSSDGDRAKGASSVSNPNRWSGPSLLYHSAEGYEGWAPLRDQTIACPGDDGLRCGAHQLVILPSTECQVQSLVSKAYERLWKHRGPRSVDLGVDPAALTDVAHVGNQSITYVDGATDASFDHGQTSLDSRLWPPVCANQNGLLGRAGIGGLACPAEEAEPTGRASQRTGDSQHVPWTGPGSLQERSPLWIDCDG